jgi:GH18 family chitinase
VAQVITKAGVPASKVLVGVTSYGRSFRMTSPSCTGPMCTYTGTRNVSNAYKGRCTDTAGYLSNAEINEIIMDNPNG